MNSDEKILRECGYDEELLESMTKEDMEAEIEQITSYRE